MLRELAVLSIITTIVLGEGDSDVVELTMDNFEHLTQLNSGATTGDWYLIRF